MKKFLYLVLLAMVCVAALHTPIQICKEADDTEPLYQHIHAHLCAYFEVDDTEGMDAPVPMAARVKNKSGSQCVWCSISTLGRYNEIESLYNLTDKREYQGPSGPDGAKRCLNKYGVKFIQITNKDYSFLEKYVHEEHRPVLFDIKGHAMVLIDYHPEQDKISYINNSDSTLKVRTWTFSEFKRRWCGWALVLFNDPDVIPMKNNPWRFIPIIGRSNKPEFFPVP